MIPSIILPILVSVLPTTGDTATKKINIDLRRQALVPGHRILLRDIANVRASDGSLARSLGDTEIGLTPQGSFARRVSQTEVLRVLAARRGVKQSDVQFGSVRESEVLAATQQISANDLVHTAEVVLRAMLAEENETDAEWKVVSRPRTIKVPLGRQGLELKASLPRGKLGRSSAVMRVDAIVDGKTAAQIPVQFRIQRFREVLVAARAIRSGETIDASAIATKRVDVSGQVVPALTDPKDLEGLVTRRALRVGTLLTTSEFRRPATVLRSQVVTLVTRVGRVRLTRKGTAMQDGGVGDVIRVAFDKTQSVLARVYGPGLAIVENTLPPRRR